MRHVTITTDFGGPSGVMQGVIWNIAPDAQIADLTWDIMPQNVLEASLELDRQAFFFPENSVHIVVVDPGVGTTRRPIAAKIGPQYFVAPDNGVLSMPLLRADREHWAVEIVHTNKPEYWLPKVSDIFHGRDIFSPVGAHLAAGVPLQALGDRIDDPVRIDIPTPKRTENGVDGEITIIYAYFGNIITNILRKDIAHLGEVDVTLCGTTIHGIVRTFGDRPPGSLVALFDECDYLYVAVVNGNAAERIHPKVGDKVEVRSRQQN
jgi:S-adenosylmethionine hydrolase